MTYIIVDFEATCCDRGSVPRDEMEIIEIGAVALCGDDSEISSEFQAFIKPQRHPDLTAFCTSLTSITQVMVDAAPIFAEQLAAFKTWIDEQEKPVFCSWGDYDRKQLQQDCGFHQQPYPFNQEHINIKKRFAKNRNMRKAPGLGRALAQMQMSFIGSPHRGIDDARNMARLAPYIFNS